MSTIHRLGTALLAVCAVFGSTAAQAGLLNLTGVVGGANVYAIHDFTAHSSDVEGAIVAGGNVTVSGYSVNARNRDAFGEQNYAVIAGGNLTLSNGSINNGVVHAGGKVSTSSAAPVSATATGPVDFAAAESYYRALTAALSMLGPTGSASPLWGGVKVTGSGQGGVDIFNVDSSMFRNSSHWMLESLTPGQTLIFNVSGASGTFNDGGISFEPLSGYNVLFNFYEATSINIKNVIGSVLAPNATMSQDWGVVNGNVIVGSWNSTVQINANHYFIPVEVAGLEMDGNKGDGGPRSEVPEPGSAALLLAGLGAAGLVRRRAKAAA